MSPPSEPHSISIILHWAIAFLILAIFPIGIYMAQTHTLELYDLHKSLGVIAYIIIVFRLIWVFWKGEIKSIAENPREKALAKFVHRLMLILTFLVPTFGMMYSASAGYGFGIFSWRIVPLNLVNGEVLPLSPLLKPILLLSHEITSYAMMLIILGHIGAAFKHHFLDKDTTLKRMLGLRTNR